MAGKASLTAVKEGKVRNSPYTLALQAPSEVTLLPECLQDWSPWRSRARPYSGVQARNPTKRDDIHATGGGILSSHRNHEVGIQRHRVKDEPSLEAFPRRATSCLMCIPAKAKEYTRESPHPSAAPAVITPGQAQSCPHSSRCEA